MIVAEIESVFHPATVGLWLCAPAWALGALLGASRATLDRLFLKPTRISPTLGYHVGFTALISTIGLLLFFEFVITFVVHRGSIASIWPWTWCAVLAWGSVAGYGWTLRLYRRMYLEALRRSVYEDDEL